MNPLLMQTLCKVVEFSLPHLVRFAEDLLEKDIDPATLNWDHLYGRSLEDLQADMEARRRHPSAAEEC